MMKNARSARLVDGADEVHMQTIAKNTIAWYTEEGNTRKATGGLL
jgi:acyl-CoA dehydrogenase